MYGRLTHNFPIQKKLAAAYSHLANFATVYISEAHPADQGDMEEYFVKINAHRWGALSKPEFFY